MKTLAVPLLVLAVLVGGCTTAPGAPAPVAPSSSPATGGGAETATGAVPPTSTSAAGGGGAVGPDEVAVETALREYQAALATGNFVRACELNSPESSVALVAAVQAGGGQVGTCEEALTAVLTQPGAADAAAEAAATTVVDGVAVDGLNATISWTSRRQGSPRSDSVRLQSIDGVWRLAGTG